jgi:hypothetical protein
MLKTLTDILRDEYQYQVELKAQLAGFAKLFSQVSQIPVALYLESF